MKIILGRLDRMFPVFRLLGCAIIIGAFSGCSTTSIRDIDYDQEYVKGTQFSPKEAAETMALVDNHPKDSAARMRLIAFMSVARFTSTEYKEPWVRNIHWFIVNKPEVANLQVLNVDCYIDGDAACKGTRDLWLGQVEKNPRNTGLIVNAASYMQSIGESGKSEELYLRAVSIAPKDYDLHQKLGYFYLLAGKYGKESGNQREMGKKALAEMEIAQGLATGNPGWLAWQRWELAESAFLAGDIAKTDMYADAMINNPGDCKKDAHLYGNSVFWGNYYRGRTSVLKGNLKEAGKYLLEAGKTPGSAQLDSFGPDFDLAQDLLDRGEKAVVVEFLESCKRFWDKEKLDGWVKSIKEGKKVKLGRFI
jgi:tetratricopeptide (TPR) repeat protein